MKTHCAVITIKNLEGEKLSFICRHQERLLKQCQKTNT